MPADQLATVDDIMNALQRAFKTNGPWDVGISPEAFDQMWRHCQHLGADPDVFFSGVCCGVELQREVQKNAR